METFSTTQTYILASHRHRVCQVLWCKWQGCLQCSLDLLQSPFLLLAHSKRLHSMSHSKETEAVFPSVKCASPEPSNAYQTWFFFLSGGRGNNFFLSLEVMLWCDLDCLTSKNTTNLVFYLHKVYLSPCGAHISYPNLHLFAAFAYLIQ